MVACREGNSEEFVLGLQDVVPGGGGWLFEAGYPGYPPLIPGTEKFIVDAVVTGMFSVPGAQLTSEAFWLKLFGHC